MGKKRNSYKILVGKSEVKRDQLEDLGVEGRTILERILVKYGEWVWTGCI
jgi:hypothetical protein